MRMRHLIAAATAAAVAWGGATAALAADKFITVASTTSTKNSGLFDYMLPKFQEKTGIEVRVVAVGTGQAIKLARQGDADVLFVHHKPSEEKVVDDGIGVKRFDVMYNDFVIIGPKSDPAGIKGMEKADATLAKISQAKAPFASRGDNSGTNKKELDLWKQAGVDVKGQSGSWYRETGSGMGATLNVASGMGAYTLSDRATWLNFKNKADLAILMEGDPVLFNQYGIIRISEEKFPHVKTELAQTFVDWVISGEGQQIIKEYKIKGQQAFFPNAKPGA